MCNLGQLLHGLLPQQPVQPWQKSPSTVPRPCALVSACREAVVELHGRLPSSLDQADARCSAHALAVTASVLRARARGNVIGYSACAVRPASQWGSARRSCLRAPGERLCGDGAAEARI
eukprot:m51a1_g11606 hypothetical protein (119) ;mRNA; f:160150-160637